MSQGARERDELFCPVLSVLARSTPALEAPVTRDEVATFTLSVARLDPAIGYPVGAQTDVFSMVP